METLLKNQPPNGKPIPLIRPQVPIDMESKARNITKHFTKEYVVVWCDHKMDRNEKEIKRLQERFILKTFKVSKEAVDFISNTSSSCAVITSGKNGEDLAKRISSFPNVGPICIYCRDTELHQKWASEYQGKVTVVNRLTPIIQKFAEYTTEGHAIVWYDSDMKSKNNMDALKKLVSISKTVTFEDYNDAAKYLKSTKDYCQVITKGTNGENFVQLINHLEKCPLRICILW